MINPHLVASGAGTWFDIQTVGCNLVAMVLRGLLLPTQILHLGSFGCACAHYALRGGRGRGSGTGGVAGP